MKYFTPELLARGQTEDDDILDEVDSLWGQQGRLYSAYLQTIRADMHPGLRTLLDGYYLHDARVQAMGYREGSFVVVLQLDTPPRSLLTLTYALVAEPAVDQQALPEEARFKGDVVEWQYDEVEKIEGEPVATWRHSILLSNGWEVTLRFREVAVVETQAILPVPPTSPGAGAVAGAMVPQHT